MSDVEFFGRPRAARKRSPGRLLTGLIFVSVLSLGSSLAANININTGQSVEFGQGMSQTTKCDSQMVVQLGDEFLNASDTNGTFAPVVRISDIANSCDEKIIRVDLLMRDGTPITPTQGIEVFFSRSANGFFLASDFSRVEISSTQVSSGVDGLGANGSTTEVGKSTFTLRDLKDSSGQAIVSQSIQKVIVQTLDRGNFQLASSVPSLSSLTASAFTSNSATIYGNVSNAPPSTQAEFCYGTDSNLEGCTKITPNQSPLSSNGSVSASLTGLTSSTTYYWRLTARNSRGTTTSSINQFETSDIYGFTWADCTSNTQAPCRLYGEALWAGVTGNTFTAQFDDSSNSGPQLRACPVGSAVVGIKAGENEYVGEVSPICATYPGKATEIALATWSLETFTVTNVQRVNELSTLTTSISHNFGSLSGNRVYVSGLSDIGFRGDFTIDTTTSNTFSYGNGGSDVTSQAMSGVASVINPSFLKIQRCASDQWLTGLGGRAGAINDAIQAFCRAPSASSSSTTALTQLGGLGGSQITSKRCPTNHLITAFWVWHPGSFMNWGGAGGGNGLAFLFKHL